MEEVQRSARAARASSRADEPRDGEASASAAARQARRRPSLEIPSLEHAWMPWFRVLRSQSQAESAEVTASLRSLSDRFAEGRAWLEDFAAQFEARTLTTVEESNQRANEVLTGSAE